MTAQVDIHDAKAMLSRLVGRVEAGEEIVIARDGRPVARLVPVRADAQTPEEKAAARMHALGCFAGRVWTAPDVDEPLDDLFDVLRDDDSWLGDVGPDEPTP